MRPLAATSSLARRVLSPIGFASLLCISACGGGGGGGGGGGAASATTSTSPAASADLATASWSIVDLGTLGRVASAATSINDLGLIVGVACTLPTEGCDAFLTAANGAGIHFMAPVGAFQIHYAPYSGSPGVWINRSGQVFGNGPTSSFMTASGGLSATNFDTTVLGLFGVNNSGQVLGIAQGDFPFISGPNGIGKTFIVQGLNSDPTVTAVAINNSGQILGTTASNGPFFTNANGSGANTVDGGDLPIGANVGVINDSAQIAGTIVVNNVGTGFVTGANGAGMTSMGTAGAWPSAMNASGQVVGPNFIFSNGKIISLTQLPAVSSAGWTSLSPLSINASAQIVGYGTIGGATHAFLLTPS